MNWEILRNIWSIFTYNESNNNLFHLAYYAHELPWSCVSIDGFVSSICLFYRISWIVDISNNLATFYFLSSPSSYAMKITKNCSTTAYKMLFGMCKICVHKMRDPNQSVRQKSFASIDKAGFKNKSAVFSCCNSLTSTVCDAMRGAYNSLAATERCGIS